MNQIGIDEIIICIIALYFIVFIVWHHWYIIIWKLFSEWNNVCAEGVRKMKWRIIFPHVFTFSFCMLYAVQLANERVWECILFWQHKKKTIKNAFNTLWLSVYFVSCCFVCLLALCVSPVPWLKNRNKYANSRLQTLSMSCTVCCSSLTALHTQLLSTLNTHELEFVFPLFFSSILCNLFHFQFSFIVFVA